MLLLGSSAAQGILSLAFSQDTLYACQNLPYSLAPQISGGQAPFTYLWSNGESGAALSLLPSGPSYFFTLTVSDASGAQASDSVWLLALPECVWPGDANGDGLANAADLLVWGESFGAQGSIRPQAHTNWIAQAAPQWNALNAAGVDRVHSDCDGDGQVGWDDPEAILQNYQSPINQSFISVSGATPLYVDFSGIPYQPGDTLTAPIILGTAQQPADSIYGLMFSLEYDGTLIDSGSVSVSFGNSWAGTHLGNLYGFYRDFAAQSQVDIALVRSGWQPVSGYGRIADITVMIDDITGKREGIEAVEMRLRNVRLIGPGGQLMPVEAADQSFFISLSQEKSAEEAGWNIYPNPAEDWLRIERPSALLSGWDWELLDGAGRSLEKGHSRSGRLELPISLPGGVYTLRLRSAEESVHQKIVVR
jgi:hypothetical protein